MAKITVEEIVRWTKSKQGGLVIGFSHAHLKVVYYFLTEFDTDEIDPSERIGVFRFGNYLVVGKQYFLEAVHRCFLK